MNPRTDLDRVLRVHFETHADPTAFVDQLDRIEDRLAIVRQRPGWMVPERWRPMSTISTRLAGAPRFPLRLVVAALLVVALAATLLFAAGALRRPVPPPFGPAKNGLLAFAADDGAINVGDPVTGASHAIVSGPDNARPIFSPDGTHVAYLHTSPGGQQDVLVVGEDGGNPTKVSTGLTASDYFGWSPDSRSVVILTTGGKLQVFDSSAATSPTTIAVDVTVGSGNYNVQAAGLFRPPDGRSVLYVRPGSPHPSLIVADANGSNPRALINEGSNLTFIYLSQTQWSPDGSMIAFVGATRDVLEEYVTYVMNADGSGLRRLSGASRPINESNPAWSPDGSRIAVQRWLVDPAAQTAEVRPITVIDVDGGDELEVGSVPPNGGNGFGAWGWSPDGASIMQLPEQHLLILDVTNGATRSVSWFLSSAPAWQRLAP